MDSGGNIVKKLSGFHHDLHWRDVGRNLFKFKNQVYDKKTHVLQAEIAGSVRQVTKTFYPKHWLSETIPEKNCGSLRALEKVEKIGKNLRFVAKTECGVKLRIISDSNGRLITAFPIF